MLGIGASFGAVYFLSGNNGIGAKLHAAVDGLVTL